MLIPLSFFSCSPLTVCFLVADLLHSMELCPQCMFNTWLCHLSNASKCFCFCNMWLRNCFGFRTRCIIQPTWELCWSLPAQFLLHGRITLAHVVEKLCMSMFRFQTSTKTLEFQTVVLAKKIRGYFLCFFCI